MTSNTIFAVGHGPRDSLDQLNAAGQHSAELATKRVHAIIIARGLPLPVILSGEHTRNLQTAKILASGLKAGAVVTSHRLTLVGDQPESIRDFGDVIAQSLSDEQVTLAPGQPAVIVTENAIPAMARGDYGLLARRELEPGAVAELVQERWDGHRFNQAAEHMIEATIAAERAASQTMVQSYVFI